MKFKIDENLSLEVVQLLRENGHDALSIFDQNMVGSTDDNIAKVCLAEGRVLITLDLDFSDMRRYPYQEYAGIIILRVRRQDKYHILSVFEQVLPLLEQETLAGRLWIVEENRVRIRDGLLKAILYSLFFFTSGHIHPFPGFSLRKSLKTGKMPQA